MGLLFYRTEWLIIVETRSMDCVYASALFSETQLSTISLYVMVLETGTWPELVWFPVSNKLSIEIKQSRLLGLTGTKPALTKFQTGQKDLQPNCELPSSNPEPEPVLAKSFGVWFQEPCSMPNIGSFVNLNLETFVDLAYCWLVRR